MAFPTFLDTWAAMAANQSLAHESHTARHNDVQAAVINVETKVGVDGSAVTTTHDYKLSGVTGSDKAASKAGSETLSNKTLTSPTLTTPTLTTPLIQAPWDGWVSVTDTWTYSSADSPTFVITVPSDATTVYSVGMRVKLTQTTVKYFLITAVSASGLTVYGGTDYTLTNSAISSIAYSSMKAPFGFPTSPTKWTVEVSDTTQRSQTPVVVDTWYNLGAVTLVIPIGVWRVEYFSNISVDGAAGTLSVYGTLSTANNSESDSDLTTYSEGASIQALFVQVTKAKVLTLAAKTTYFFNTKTHNSANDLYNLNDRTKQLIRAVCSYL